MEVDVATTRASTHRSYFLLPVSVYLSTYLLIFRVDATSTASTTTTTTNSSTNSTTEQEDREYMDTKANAALTSLGLNTLTTSCNGGCGVNSPCVIVGSSSENRINCVNDKRCTTLSSGQSALCMEPFTGSELIWGFYPAKANDSIGIAPFERVGLVQPADSVGHVLFRRSEDQFGPLQSLDVSSINIQPSFVISNITFDGLTLTGVENALPVNSALQINIVNCNITAIPTQMLSGANLQNLDLSANAITSGQEIRSFIFPSLTKLNLQDNQIASLDELTSATFPALMSLVLDGNQLTSIPPFIFDVATLTTLSMDRNPVDASLLTAAQFTFLAKLESFAIAGVTETTACPPVDVIAKLNGSFTFCIDTGGSSSGSGSSGSGSDNGGTITFPPPTTIVQDPSSSNDSKTAWIVGVTVGVLVVVALIALLFWWLARRRNHRSRETEPYKPTFTSIGSFIGGGGPLGGPSGKQALMGGADESSGSNFLHGGGDAFVALRSNESSEHSSDSYPILGNIATDGPDGLPRLSYQDLYLHRLLRVSSRSELWLGEYFDEAVVVKKIKSNTVSRAIMRDFVEEVKLMATLKHPRIVDFRGALWDKSGSELCAVVEYMDHGPLRNTTNSMATTGSRSGASKEQFLPVPKQHAIARQIAEALCFLHSQKIVHGRLNAFNILLDRELSAKLSLFSIFHYVRLSPLDYECAVFVSPEVQRGEQPSEKADLFAFGVVLVELTTGESPEQNRRRRRASMAAAGSAAASPNALSPAAGGVAGGGGGGLTAGFALGDQCSSLMKNLISVCLERDPARRPSMDQVVNALRTGEIVM